MNQLVFLYFPGVSYYLANLFLLQHNISESREYMNGYEVLVGF